MRRVTADPELRLEEARGLAMAIGIVVAEAMAIPIRTVRPGTLFGEGQIQRIADACNREDAELVIVDGALSAVQQRNLEEKLKRKVIDRTGLILEIFGERAATPRDGSRSNWRTSTTRPGDWCAAGPTSNANAAVSASLAGRAKPRSKPTGD